MPPESRFVKLPREEREVLFVKITTSRGVGDLHSQESRTHLHIMNTIDDIRQFVQKTKESISSRSTL